MISAKTETTEIKDKTKRLLEVIKRAQGAYVTAGIHSDAGTYPDGTAVADVALWNEYGTRRSPERPFFRNAIDGNQSKINYYQTRAVDKILDKNWTVQQALEMVGFRLQTLIQDSIKSNTPPPNAKSTLAAKKRDGVGANTLIWTGKMLNSVTFKVYAK